MNQKSTMPGLWSVLTAHHDVPVWPLGVPPYKQEGQGGMDLSMHMAKSATDKEPTVFFISTYKAYYITQTDKFLYFFKSFFSLYRPTQNRTSSQNKT